MCGIIGYVGRESAVPILLAGLQRLEYRGYDSAGIAIQHNGNLDGGAAVDHVKQNRTGNHAESDAGRTLQQGGCQNRGLNQPPGCIHRFAGKFSAGMD